MFEQHIPFTRVEYRDVRYYILETRILHQSIYAPTALDRALVCARPHHRPRARSVVISTRERTNERTTTTTTTMALSFARISSTAGCVSRFDRSNARERARIDASSSSLAPIHRARSYRARSYLGRAIDDDGERVMMLAWRRVERHRDACDDDDVCSNVGLTKRRHAMRRRGANDAMMDRSALEG